MSLAPAALVALALASAPGGRPSEARFPQLISTRYEAGAKLPEGVARPAPSFDFVDRSRLPEGAKLLSAARSARGDVWVVTDRGAFHSSGDAFEPLEVGPRTLEPGQPPVRPNARVSAVVEDAAGHIWVATDRGVYVTDGAQWWQKLDQEDGVPFVSVTCLHLTPEGDAWAGTPEGAWRLRDGQFRYFWGKRWLPGNRVHAIWSGGEGKVWLETDGGLACIEERPATLAEKARHYEAITRGRHIRRGFVCAIDLDVPGDPTGRTVFDVSDNDGLWTSLYVAAMSLRYGATKDPEAKAHARESMNALLDLERLSGIPGFPARAMATDAEVKAGVRGVNFEAKVHAPGETEKVWYRSKVAPDLWCKGDTSSDELDGHYVAWYLYHDLVADPAERREIAAVVRRVTDHILDHCLTLVDHTGRKTRWGIWAPELINRDPFYHTLRPLNSIEILAFLKVAGHITGDARYGRVADELIEKHHYLLNTLLMRRGETGRWPGINHSDDELLYLAYYPLLRLEEDPARRRILLQGLERTWQGSPGEQGIRPEHSPFYNFLYGALTGRPCDVDEARQTLQDWPWELIDWTTQNSHRHDVRILSAPGIRKQQTQLDRVLPASERSQGRWNQSPWRPDGEGAGRREHDGVAWTVSYWLGVYHGFLEP